MIGSAIYICNVMHKRMRPRSHILRHQQFSICIDLDNLDFIDKQTLFFSIDKPNLISFYQKDRGDGRHFLTEYVRGVLAEHGLQHAGHRIFLMTMPRVLGISFNPLSVYYCFDDHDQIRAILWEVDNTFKERHSYLNQVEQVGSVIKLQSQKCFYVSPFMEADLSYRFLVKVPGDRFMTTIQVSDIDGLLLVAQQSGTRRKLDNFQLISCLFRCPFQFFNVVLAIHWHALILWLKGVPPVAKKIAHTGKVTYVRDVS
ncbi:MAG: DUF1365 domain-containing protein [Beijerinckiaceae bacterium]